MWTPSSTAPAPLPWTRSSEGPLTKLTGNRHQDPEFWERWEEEVYAQAIRYMEVGSS